MDLENYFFGDRNFSEAQEAQLLALNQELRGIVDQAICLNTDTDTLKSLTEQAKQLKEKMAQHQGIRPLAAYNKVFRHDDVGYTYAYSPITGRANPMAPPMHTAIENDRVISTVTFSQAYEGPPGCVHGGIVALAWDHVLAAGTMIKENRGPTAHLTIHYRHPTPLNREITFHAELDRIEGKKVYVKGQCFDGDTLLTEAEGLFIHTLIKEIDVTEEHLKQEVRK